MKRRSGQVLILVLLVVVVALAVGLSVASRNITNLRTSTQTAQSQRAFTAAEGGVEDVLSRLSTFTAGLGAGSSKSEPVTIGSLTANVTVNSLGTYDQTVEEGNVLQIDLKGPPVASGVLKIEWAKTSDAVESAAPASIEVVEIDGTGGIYNQSRTAWAGVNPRGPNESGFSSSSPWGCPSSEFARCTTITVSSATPIVLRIRPFWNKTTIRVSATGSGSLPAQAFDITSTATASTSDTSSGITRKVKVTRSRLPQLPAVFDYVLFSEGDIVK